MDGPALRKNEAGWPATRRLVRRALVLFLPSFLHQSPLFRPARLPHIRFRPDKAASPSLLLPRSARARHPLLRPGYTRAMRFVEMLVVVSAACASLAAAAASAHSRPLGPRSIEQPSWHTLERRSKTGLCTQAYVDNKHSNYCKQTCPLNQVPLFGACIAHSLDRERSVLTVRVCTEGGCVCPSPYKSQGKNCVPDCKNGYVSASSHNSSPSCSPSSVAPSTGSRSTRPRPGASAARAKC